ncbi:unnamed protein product, partial [Meganyctiphanes norvegica]
MYGAVVVAGVIAAIATLLTPVCESCGDALLFEEESWFSPAHNRQPIKISRPERSPIPDVVERVNCQPGDTPPPNRVNTTARIDALRKEMLVFGLDAYIIVNEKEKRRDYISGFDGSAGTAVVTSKEAALWTDGRYWLQAEDQLDCHWILMRQDEDNVMTNIECFFRRHLDTLFTGQLVSARPTMFGSGCGFKWKYLNRSSSSLI